MAEDSTEVFFKLKFAETLLCIAPDQEVKIRGQSEIDSVALNFDFVACTKNGTVCVSDQTIEEMREALVYPELFIYYNDVMFDPLNFESIDKAIQKRSLLWNSHVDKSRANWMKTLLKEH